MATRKKKDELTQHLEEAKASDHYMVCVWNITPDGQLRLFRLSNNFPFVDIPESLAMLQRDLEPITLKKPEEGQ